MRVYSNIRFLLCILFVAFLTTFLFSVLYSSQAYSQSSTEVNEAKNKPGEPSRAPSAAAPQSRASSPYWRAFIWEAIPPEKLSDPTRSQVLEAYQQNEWRPLFVGSNFELNQNAEVLLARLHHLLEDAIDPSPYALDALQKRVSNLQRLHRALAAVDPSCQDTRADFDGKGSPGTSSQTGHGPASVQGNGDGSVPPPADPRLQTERINRYREVFKAASEVDLQLAFNLVRLASEMNPHAKETQAKALLGQIPMDEFIGGIEPSSPKYKTLKSAMQTYSNLASSAPQQHVAASSKLQPGDTGESVRNLQKRLQQEGFLGEKISGVFDAATKAAVKEFQKMHLMEEDGVAGKQTIEWLNVSYREKARMIATAMKQLRTGPARVHDRYVRINIPQFTLEYYKGGEIHAAHRVIVGKASGKKIKFQGRMIGENHTPPLSSAIEQVVINPHWIVTDRIRIELNGEAGNDPSYFSRNGYVQMSSHHPWGEPRLYMPPGPGNPLGRVRFDFPNDYAVYLHDTPKKHLFQRARRDFSHGCIRVEKAQELAQTILADDDNPAAQKTQNYLSTNRQVYIRLTQPLPIVIEYLQVSFDGSNRLVFCGDPYGWFKEEPGKSS